MWSCTIFSLCYARIDKLYRLRTLVSALYNSPRSDNCNKTMQCKQSVAFFGLYLLCCPINIVLVNVTSPISLTITYNNFKSDFLQNEAQDAIPMTD